MLIQNRIAMHDICTVDAKSLIRLKNTIGDLYVYHPSPSFRKMCVCVVIFRFVATCLAKINYHKSNYNAFRQREIECKFGKSYTLSKREQIFVIVSFGKTTKLFENLHKHKHIFIFPQQYMLNEV